MSTGFAQAVSIRMEASSVRTSETMTTTLGSMSSDPESCSSVIRVTAALRWEPSAAH